MPINSLATLEVLRKWFVLKPIVSLSINSFSVGRALGFAFKKRLARQ